MWKLMRLTVRYYGSIYRNNLTELFQPVMLLVIISGAFSITLTDFDLLRLCSPAILTIGTALSTLYMVDQVFRKEYQYGTLIDLILSPYSLPMMILFRLLLMMLMIGLCLSLTLLPVAYMLKFPMNHYVELILFAFNISSYFCLIGTIGSSLTIDAQKSGLILMIIVLPMSMPMVLAGTYFLEQTLSHGSTLFPLYLMLFLNTLSLTLSPFFISAALKLHAAYSPNH